MTSISKRAFAFRIRLGLCVLSIFGFAPPAAVAGGAWLEASSDRFIVYSDLSEKSLRRFATRLEQFDAALRVVFREKPVDAGARSNRLRVYMVSSTAEVRRLCGPKCTGVAGFYLTRVGGSLVFTPRSYGSNSPDDLDAEQVLLHEYTHHFMRSNFPAAYPAWFAEGFAEMAASAQFGKDGSLLLALPANHRARSLYQDSLSLDRMMTVSVFDLDPRNREVLYGRGWLLTHYLFFGTSQRQMLSEYLAALNSGIPSIDAAKQAFGDLEKLNRELDHYMRSRLKGYKFAPDALPLGTIEIRPLSEGVSAMMAVHTESTSGVTRETALKLLPSARRTAAPFPNDPVVQAQLAEAEYDAGNLAEAEAAADRALAADPRNIDALMYKGRVLLARAYKDKTTDGQTWRSARSWFVKANSVDRDAALPLVLFYDSFGAAGMKPTANAVLGLNRAYELSPEDSSLRMRVAYQALVDDRPKLARQALAPLAFDPHARSATDWTLKIITLIDAGKTSEAAQAMMSEIGIGGGQKADVNDDTGS